MQNITVITTVPQISRQKSKYSPRGSLSTAIYGILTESYLSVHSHPSPAVVVLELPEESRLCYAKTVVTGPLWTTLVLSFRPPVLAYLRLYARFLGRMRVFSADMYRDQLDGGTHAGSSKLHRKTQQDTFDHVLIVLINLWDYSTNFLMDFETNFHPRSHFISVFDHFSNV